MCRTYWYPLYAFVRRKGHSPHDAQDLTQAFFAGLLEKNFFPQASGRTAGFALAAGRVRPTSSSTNGTSADVEARRSGREFLSLDDDTAENRYLLEPATDLTPERLYERRRVQVLLDQVLARLREQFAADAKEDLFDHLRVFLTDVKGTVSSADCGGENGYE